MNYSPRGFPGFPAVAGALLQFGGRAAPVPRKSSSSEATSGEQRYGSRSRKRAPEGAIYGALTPLLPKRHTSATCR
jgi:hypothetical protein